MFEFKNAPMFIGFITFSNEKFIKPVKAYNWRWNFNTDSEQPKTLSGEEKIILPRCSQKQGIIYLLGHYLDNSDKQKSEW